MNMHSELLGIDLPVNETEDGLSIISHDTLRRIVRENSSRLSVEWKPLVLRPDICGFEATARDNETGRVEIEIGESNPKNLKNPISKENPIIMAQYRAYDRALIQLLDLPSKVYSSNEIQNAKFVSDKPAEQQTESVPAPDNAVAAENADADAGQKTEHTDVPEPEPKADIVFNCEIRPEDGKFAIFDLTTGDYINRKNGTHFLFATREEAVTQLEKREENRKAKLKLLFADDETILIGAYNGKKYGDVKNDEKFIDFCRSLKEKHLAFGDKERMDQLQKLQKLAETA